MRERARGWVWLATLLVAGCATGNAREGRDAGRVTSADGGTDAAHPSDVGTQPDTGLDDAATTGDDAASTGDDAAASDDAATTSDDAAASEDAAVTLPDAGRDTGPVDLCAGVDCSSMVSGCNTATCNPSTGLCVIGVASDGTTCTDGTLCTTGDTCHGGVCTGTAIDCSAMSTTCALAACDGSTGACVLHPRAEGATCGASGTCAPSTCVSGTCTAGATIADCGSCGGGNYCAAGVCGANPTSLAPQGFESGALPTGWTNGYGGTTAWRFVASGAHSGTYRAQSGAIGNSASSGLAYRVTVPTTATLSFWLMTSSEVAYDYLHVLVDGVEAGSWAGTTAWTQASLGLGAGTHTIEWRYTKDAATMAGSDAVWIDDVTLTSPAPSASSDFEATALPIHFVAGGALPWITNTTSPHGGARSAASGAITDDQTTSMFTTLGVSSATTLSFWYRVSTEASYDFLDVYVDGTRQVHAAGTVGWTMVSAALSVGTHVVEWRYAKDASALGGSDRVWIDDVVIGSAPATGGLCP